MNIFNTIENSPASRNINVLPAIDIISLSFNIIGQDISLSFTTVAQLGDKFSISYWSAKKVRSVDSEIRESYLIVVIQKNSSLYPRDIL